MTDRIDDYTGLPVGCPGLRVDDVEITINDIVDEALEESACHIEKRSGDERRCDHRRKNDTALRFNEGKARLSLLLDAPHAVEGVVEVLEYGCKKYSRSNWKKGLNHTEVIDSMLRHISSYLKGEDVDKESGLPHVDHVATNAIFLSELVRIKPEFDDRKRCK